MAELLILGGGVSGIAACHYAVIGSMDAEIFEARSSYGGLLDNFTVDGFRFDRAVHLSFTSDPIVRELFDQVEQYRYKPAPVNYDNGLLLKHPVQTNLYPLPVDEKVKAVKSFLERTINPNPENYEQWLKSSLGEYISQNYPERFTRKYWTVAAKQLSCDWIGNRLYSPDIEEVLFGAMSDATPNNYYAQEMRYPRKGGYKAFLKPLLSNCPMSLGCRAVCVDYQRGYVEFEDDRKEYFHNLLSTIPLPELIKIIKDVPVVVRDAASQLYATSVVLASVGFSDPDIAEHLWFYIYDEDVLAARVNSPSMKAADATPLGCSSLQFEYYTSQLGKKIIPPDEYIENVMTFLKCMGLGDGSICVADTRTLQYANVIFTKDMSRNRNIILNFLADKNIYTAGRFGEWDYLWSDQALLSGKNSAEKILAG